MMKYAIILAGGAGKRFWPISRESEPKQFLSIGSTRPMLEETLNKISGFFRKENIYIGTNKLHHQKVKNCLESFSLPLNNILLEPESKNTFSPIALLSKRIKESDSEAVIAVLPCDNLIRNKKIFLRLLNDAIKAARVGHIVTLGVSPKRPDTGYGYIKVGTRYKVRGVRECYRVEKFVEKPGLKAARKFLEDKRYYWNNGIFVFKASVILDEIKRVSPAVFKIISGMRNIRDFQMAWHKLPATSVDYAVMEKARNMLMLPADYGWIDLGGWRALEEIFKKDRDGNIFKGNCIDIGSHNILVYSKKNLVATAGLDNVIIVNTDDAILVCAKDRVQDIKKIVQVLKQKKLKIWI